MIILCRTCKEWFTTSQWKGNCKKHPFWKNMYSQEANPNEDCKGRDFVDKYAKYQGFQNLDQARR